MYKQTSSEYQTRVYLFCGPKSHYGKTPYLNKIYFVGKLPRTIKGNTMFLVAVYHFYKFTWLCPDRETTSIYSIKALAQTIFQNFGFPKIIISHWFASNMFCNYCFSDGIKHATLSPYHPQPSNAEPLNRNLKSTLIP